MTGEIVIFDRGTAPKPTDSKNAALVAAIDAVAPRALQSVAGNDEDTARVKQLLKDVRYVAAREGRAGAMQYMTQINALAA